MPQKFKKWKYFPQIHNNMTMKACAEISKITLLWYPNIFPPCLFTSKRSLSVDHFFLSLNPIYILFNKMHGGKSDTFLLL